MGETQTQDSSLLFDATQQMPPESQLQSTQGPAVKPWGYAHSVSGAHPNISLVHDITTFGRRENNTVHLTAHQAISGKHCSLEKHGDVIFLVDHSSNGTFLKHKGSTRQRMQKGERKVIGEGDQFDIVKHKNTHVGYVLHMSDSATPVSGDIRDHYDIRDKLGDGAFSAVHLGVHRVSGIKYAIKVANIKNFHENNASDRNDTLHDEMRLLTSLNHPYIVHVHGTFETKDNLYLVLELMKGGDLFDRVVARGPLSEVIACRYFVQLCYALKYLDLKGIVHRDIKPENILLSDSKDDYCSVKLTDFGLSRKVDGGPMKTLCGTPQYLAPEVQLGYATSHLHTEAPLYDNKVDIWSLGTVLYVMLSASVPFGNGAGGGPADDVRTRRRILEGQFDFPDREWKNISTSAKALICETLKVDPKERISVDECLRHPWVQTHMSQAFPEEKEGLVVNILEGLPLELQQQQQQPNNISTSSSNSSASNDVKLQNKRKQPDETSPVDTPVLKSERSNEDDTNEITQDQQHSVMSPPQAVIKKKKIM